MPGANGDDNDKKRKNEKNETGLKIIKKVAPKCCNKAKKLKKKDKNTLKTIPDEETRKKMAEKEAAKEGEIPITYEQACTDGLVYRVECKDGMIIRHVGRRVSDKIFKILKPYRPCHTGGFLREVGGCVMMPLRIPPRNEQLDTEGCALENLGEVLENTKSYIEPGLLRPSGRISFETELGNNILYPVPDVKEVPVVVSEEHPPYPIYHNTGTPEIMLREDVFGVIQNPSNPAEDIYVMRYTWSTKNRMTVSVITYGATVTSIKTPDKKGVMKDIVWGFDTLEEYMSPNNKYYFGATIGRVTNIIPNASYKYLHDFYELRANVIDYYAPYDDRAQFNGGRKGFDKFIWTPHIEGTKVYMTHINKHRTEGYPGKVFTTICFEVKPTNELHIEMKATTTLTTPLNLTNCIYFNLAGHGSGPVKCNNHLIDINACRYCKTADNHVPTGEIPRVCGTIFDIRVPHGVGELNMKGPCGGYDHNMCINHDDSVDLDYVARLYYPESGRMLEIYSNQPGVQFSTCNYVIGDRVVPVNIYDPKLLMPPITTEDVEIQCNMDEEVTPSESSDSISTEPQTKSKPAWTFEEWGAQFVHNGRCTTECPCAMTDEVRLEMFLNSQRLDADSEEMEVESDDGECLPECPGICKQMQKICEEEKLTEEENRLALQRALGRSCLDEATNSRPCKNPLREMKCPRPESKRGPCGTSVEELLKMIPSDESVMFEPTGDYLPGKNGAKYVCNGAILLQTQKYPDALHHKNFPSIMLHPGEVYTHRIKYVFGVQITCEEENPEEEIENMSDSTSVCNRFIECMKKTCQDYFANLGEEDEIVLVDASTQTS